MVTGKIVDELIEPQLHEAGIDGYADGLLRGLTHLWHLTMDLMLGPETLGELQRLFVDVAWSRRREAIDEFMLVVDRLLVDHGAEKMPGLMLLRGSRGPLLELLNERPLPSLEPAIPAFQALAYAWAQDRPEGFSIRHDVRNEATRWRPHQDVYFDQSRNSANFDLPSGDSVALPLRVLGFEFAPSRDHPALQVADVAASATAFLLSDQPSSDKRVAEFRDELRDSCLAELVIESSLWPDPDVIGQRLSGIPGDMDAMFRWAVGERSDLE